jgi:hypothetical protein
MSTVQAGNARSTDPTCWTSTTTICRGLTLLQSYRATRDGFGASYRAGLAGGGEDCNWVQWYRNRIADYRRAAQLGASQALKTRSYRRSLEQLPAYGT